MTQRNRRTLADNFSDGRLPSEEAFGDLIDSMVNIVDDGLEMTREDGLKIAQVGNGDKLISFFDKIPVKEPLWSIAFSIPPKGGESGGSQNLNFFYGGHHATGLTLAPGGGGAEADKPGEALIRVGVNNNNPEHAIDVEGVVSSNGRIGREGGEEKRQVLADGEWHPIITGLDGCQAFEIMAGVGKRNSGRYALLHAFALSTFNSAKGNITSHQAYFSSKCDQIDLRWTGTAHNYSLEMRTRCSFLKKNAGNGGKKEEIHIRYHVTQLWFDSFMDGCAAGAGHQRTRKEHRPAPRHAGDHEAGDHETGNREVDYPETGRPERPARVAATGGEGGIAAMAKKIGDMLKSIGRKL